MKRALLIILTILPLATPAFADRYQDCVTNLDQGTGTASGDERLSSHELSYICTLPKAESTANCIIDFDQNTSMTSKQAMKFCLSEPSRSIRECAKNIMTNTGTQNGDSPLCTEDVMSACSRSDSQSMSECIVDMDQNTSMTAHDSLLFCMKYPSRGLRDCAKNLMSNTGTANGDSPLSAEDVQQVCSRPDRERLSECVINFDANTSMTAIQSLHACLRGGE